MMKDIRKSIVRIETDDDLGTGFLISSVEGKHYIITCAHVLKQPSSLSIKAFSVSKNQFCLELKAELLRKYDEQYGDVAILECKDSIDSGGVLQVDWKYDSFQTISVVTYGFPKSGQINGEYSECEMITGEFSDDWNIPKMKLINSNDISFGYSGAPIINKFNSKIIGMVDSVKIPDNLSRGINSSFVTPISFIQTKLNANRIEVVNKSDQGDNLIKVATTANPLVIGVLIDVSKTNIHNLDNIYGKVESTGGIDKGIVALKRKIISFCKSPNTGQILPLIKLFIFGTGFGEIEKQVLTFFEEIGMINSNIDKIESNNVRNLFKKAKNHQGLSDIPTASMLNENWSNYSDCLTGNLLDAGWRVSNFSLGFEKVTERYSEEFDGQERFSYLLFLTDGTEISTEFNALSKTVNTLKLMNVNIIILYCNSFEYLPDKRLLQTKSNKWPKDLQSLFDLASVIDVDDRLQNKIVAYATSKGWDISNNSKLIYQITSEKTIEDIIDILLTPIKAI